MADSRLEELKARRDKLIELKQKRDSLISQRDQGIEAEQPSFTDLLKKTAYAVTEPQRLLNRGAKDIGAGMMSAAENIVDTIPELMGHQMKRHDFGKMVGIENPNAVDKFLQMSGKTIPGAALLPAGILPGALAAGAYGFTQVEPGEQGLIDRSLGLKENTGFEGRIRNAVEDMLLTGAIGGAAKGIYKGGKTALNTDLAKSVMDKIKGVVGIKPPKYSELGEAPNPSSWLDVEAKFGEPQRFTGYGQQENSLMNQQIRFGEGESQFTNQPRQSPEFLRYNEPSPEMPSLGQEPVSAMHGIEADQIPSKQQPMARQIYDYLSGGRNLNEASQYNAAHVNKTFGRLEDVGIKKYDNIFKAPEFMDEAGQPKTYEQLLGDKQTKKQWIRQAESENKTVFDNFVTNPTLQNAQKAKNELAAEKRQYEKIIKTKSRTLTPEEKIDYQSVRYRHDFLEKEINSLINKEAPYLEGELTKANEYWRDNVANWYPDKALFRIAKGHETNPSSATLSGIFKNPEPEMMQVVKELGEPGQRAIMLHGIGKARGNYTPKLMDNILESLEEKGLLPHITPEFRSHIGNIQSQVKQESELAKAIKKHQEEVSMVRKENKEKISQHEKSMNKHEKRKLENERLIEKLQNVEPTGEALPNYQGIKVSYPKAQTESEKIVANAGGRHGKLTEEILKYTQRMEKNKAEAAEHAAAMMAASASLLGPKSWLTSYKMLRTGQRGIGKIVKAIRNKE